MSTTAQGRHRKLRDRSRQTLIGVGSLMDLAGTVTYLRVKAEMPAVQSPQTTRQVFRRVAALMDRTGPATRRP